MDIMNQEMCSKNCPCAGDEQNSLFTFDTFQECWTESISYLNIYNPEIVRYVSEYMSVMSEFEDKFGCSGFCESGQFWLTKSVALGAPSSACYETTENNNNEAENYLVKL